MTTTFVDYANKLQDQLAQADWGPVAQLADELELCLKEGRNVYLCGNGGSAANAQHIANDLLYGVSPAGDASIRVEALSSNTSVITCLANDIGYDQIFARQIKVKARAGDLLIVLSGSGNSPNILKALEAGRDAGMTTCAILGYSGGRAKSMADLVLHFDVNDMQIAEDLQLTVGHMLMRYLCELNWQAMPKKKIGLVSV